MRTAQIHTTHALRAARCMHSLALARALCGSFEEELLESTK